MSNAIASFDPEFNIKQKPFTILIADDGEDFVKFLKVEIKKAFENKYLTEPTIIPVLEGEDALEKIKNNGIDFATIDYEFNGGINGREVMKALQGTKTKLIGLTVHKDKVDEMRKLGAESFDKTDVSKCISFLLGNALQVYADDLRKREENLEIVEESIINIIQSQKEPHQNMRIKSLWLMGGFLFFWLCWKFTGYAIINPSWAIIGSFIGFCFFVMSFILKFDIKRKKRDNLTND